MAFKLVVLSVLVVFQAQGLEITDKDIETFKEMKEIPKLYPTKDVRQLQLITGTQAVEESREQLKTKPIEVKRPEQGLTRKHTAQSLRRLRVHHHRNQQHQGAARRAMLHPGRNGHGQSRRPLAARGGTPTGATGSAKASERFLGTVTEYNEYVYDPFLGVEYICVTEMTCPGFDLFGSLLGLYQTCYCCDCNNWCYECVAGK